MKKRFLNLLLALALVVCVLPMAADAATCSTHNKKNTKLVEAKAATCLEPGNIEHYICEKCGLTFVSAGTGSVKKQSNVTIAALGHQPYDKEAIEPTCSTVGRTAGKQCGRDGCKMILEGMAEIPTTKHNYTVWVETLLEPTCTERGKDLYKCENCDATKKVYVEAKGHLPYDKEEIAPTCTTVGRTAGKQCGREGCKMILEGMVEIPMTDHTPGKMIRYITRPTCQATGEAEYECTGEGCEATVKQVIRKLNCNIVELKAKAPNCNDTGLTAGTKCATCEADADHNCAWCKAEGNLVAQTVVPKLGHDHVLDKEHPDYKKATCSDTGVDVFDCTRCGYDDVHVTTPALGCDKEVTVLRKPTCVIDGYQFVQCKREGCGVWTYEAIPATGHDHVAMDAVAPTCTATGLTAGEKCSVCGEVFTAQTVVEKLPHAWEDVEAQDPTCKADGYNAHKACTECGETDGKTVIPASAAYHEYENFKCKHCGAYDPSHQHQGTGVVTTESTCTAEGVKSFECTGCGHTWTESVAKKPHTYNAKARCTECGALDPDHQHNYVQTDYRAPTCTVEGKVTKKCSVCDDLTETLIDANGHSYENGKCVGCGIAAACAHDHTTTTVESNPTCKRAGKKVTTCDSCGKTVGTEVIPATGKHNYVNNRCTGCGQNDPSRITNDFQDVFIVG